MRNEFHIIENSYGAGRKYDTDLRPSQGYSDDSGYEADVLKQSSVKGKRKHTEHISNPHCTFSGKKAYVQSLYKKEKYVCRRTYKYKGIFMAQNYVVPNIYQDMSNQSQGYFAFRFVCQHCYWQIDTSPSRSNVATATNVMDIGIGMLNGFWGRAAEAGEKIYGSQWHAEQAKALQKAWGEIQHNFHLCPKCHRTVCMRCFNVQLNLCTECAPDLKADGAQFQHQMNVDAQRAQIEQHYQAPQFNVGAIPSAITPDLMQPGAAQPQLPVQSVSQQLTPAAIAGFGTPGYPKEVSCPTCRKAGPPGKFCQDCGTKLPMPELFCPNCSSQLENSTRFCPECGTKLTNAV